MPIPFLPVANGETVMGSWNTFWGGNSGKIVLSSTKKGSTLKGKNLLPMGANSFLLEWTPFQKGLSVQFSKRSQKLSPLVEMVNNLPSVLIEVSVFSIVYRCLCF